MSTPLETGSLYADAFPRLIQDLRRAISNELSWRLPFDAYNLLPGERQGQLMVNSLDVDSDRPDLDEVRLGRMAKVVTLTLWHQCAFDSEGMTGDEAVLYAESLFLAEAIAIEHRLGRISSYLDAPDWIEKLVLNGAIDPRRSTPLKDGGRTWVVDVTTDLALSFFVNADVYGQHLPMGSFNGGTGFPAAYPVADPIGSSEVEWLEIVGVPTVLDAIADLTPVNNRAIGFNGSGDVALLPLGGDGSTKYSQTFTDADLSIADLLPVTHSLNSYPAGVLIFDNTGDKIVPDDINVSSLNALSINLATYRPLSGTWRVQIL